MSRLLLFLNRPPPAIALPPVCLPLSPAHPPQEEPESLALSPEDLEKRLESLLDTCTYTVFNYTRRGLFDRDKLIVLTLLTFAILLRSQAIDA
jgi:hypothetical protein